MARLGLDFNRGAKRAREARKQLGLDPAAPLICLLTAVEDGAELPVVVTRMPTEVAGACWRNGAGAVLWVNALHARTRQRFTLAHELGHCWCKHDGSLLVESYETLNGTLSNANERQANAFAAEFLAPKTGMEERFGGGGGEPGLDDVVQVASDYGVSAMVVAIRLKQLELASLERTAALQAEIDEGLHLPRYEALGLEPCADRLEALEDPPYLSDALAGSQLEAGLRGDVAVDPALGRAIDRLLS